MFLVYEYKDHLCKFSHTAIFTKKEDADDFVANRKSDIHYNGAIGYESSSIMCP